MPHNGRWRRLALLCASCSLASGLVGRSDSDYVEAVGDHSTDLWLEDTAAATAGGQPPSAVQLDRKLDVQLDVKLPGLSFTSDDEVDHRASAASSQLRTRDPKATGASMMQIFTLCVCMYGGIAGLWAFYWTLPEAHPARAYGKVMLMCTTWASMSIGMQVLNKTLVTMLKAPALISVGQMWIAVVLVGVPSYKQLLDAPKDQLLIWLIVPLFFAAMLCTSCYTYQYISLSFYTVIRNMTPLVVLPIERTVMPADKRPKLSWMVLLSMGVMLAGALMYGGGVGSVSVIGCIFAFANMFIAVGDRLTQRRLLTSECSGLASAVCTVMNNAFGSIPALVLAAATHQISDMSSPAGRAAWTDPRVLVLLVLSGAIGIGICYLGLECQRAISATSFFVLQNVSKVAVIVCGIMFFQDPIKSPLAVAGLALSVGGSFGYGKAQMELQEQAREAQEAGKKQAQAKDAQAQKAV